MRNSKIAGSQKYKIPSLIIRIRRMGIQEMQNHAMPYRKILVEKCEIQQSKIEKCEIAKIQHRKMRNRKQRNQKSRNQKMRNQKCDAKRCEIQGYEIETGDSPHAHTDTNYVNETFSC